MVIIFSKYGFQIAYITSMFENIRLYHLSSLSKADKINLWHRQLGHYNINKIRNKIIQKKKKKLKFHLDCQICSHSKLKKFFFFHTKKIQHNKSKKYFRIPTYEFL